MVRTRLFKCFNIISWHIKPLGIKEVILSFYSDCVVNFFALSCPLLLSLVLSALTTEANVNLSFFLTRPGFQFSFLMNRDRQANVHRVVLDSNKIKIWTQAEHVGTHDSRRSYPWCVLKSGSHTGMTAVDSLFSPFNHCL